MSAVGTIVGIDVDHDVVVQYSSQNRWTLNPVILKKVSTGEAPPRLSLVLPDPFKYGEGDFVKISSDPGRMQELQAGHGEWVEQMKQVGVDTVHVGGSTMHVGVAMVQVGECGYGACGWVYHACECGYGAGGWSTMHVGVAIIIWCR